MKIRNSNFFMDPELVIYSIEYKNLKKSWIKIFSVQQIFFYKI